MAQFPLAALQKVRKIRLQSCARELQARQNVVAQAKRALEECEQQIRKTLDEQQCARQALHQPAARSALYLTQQQSRIEWLEDRLAIENQTLAKAEETLDNAQQALREKQREYRKLEAKVQALKTVKTKWRKRIVHAEEIAQDIESEELSNHTSNYQQVS